MKIVPPAPDPELDDDRTIQIEMMVTEQMKDCLVTLGFLKPLRRHDWLAVSRALQAFVDHIPDFLGEGKAGPK